MASEMHTTTSKVYFFTAIANSFGSLINFSRSLLTNELKSKETRSKKSDKID